jgi:hypothetical protein
MAEQTDYSDVHTFLQLFVSCTNLNATEAQALSEKVRRNSADLESRLRLLIYSEMAHELNDGAIHMLWIIENAPRTVLSLLSSIYTFGSVEVRQKIDAAWHTQLALHPNDYLVLRNAVYFFQFENITLAVELLDKAIAICPADDYTMRHLGQLAGDISPSRSLKIYETVLAHSENDKKKLASLIDVANSALHAEVYDRSADAATTTLAMAESVKGTSDYGRAIHYGNMVLCKVALKSDDTVAAESYFIAASKTTGSPDLNSFGPDFSLCEIFLGQGKRELVKTYLTNCSSFWKKQIIDQWLVEIEAGVVPRFNESWRY